MISAEGVELLVEGADPFGGDAKVRSQPFGQDAGVSTGFGVAGPDLGAELDAEALNLPVDVLSQTLFQQVERFSKLGIHRLTLIASSDRVNV